MTGSHAAMIGPVAGPDQRVAHGGDRAGAVLSFCNPGGRRHPGGRAAVL